MEDLPEPPPLQEGNRPAVIIGNGRMGEAVRRMGIGEDIVVKRGEPFPKDAAPGPIYVCTRNDSLEDVIAMTPTDRWEDFVFIQNGNLLPLLERELPADLPITILIGYLAVAKRGDIPRDVRTDMDPNGLTTVNASGKWAKEVEWRLNTSNFKVHIRAEPTFSQSYWEKNIWTAAYMLAGALHGGCTVGEVEADYRLEVDHLARELATAVTAFHPDMRWDRGLMCERLASYARSIPRFPTALEDFEWRNGAFYDFTLKAQSAGRLDPCPLHTEGLRRVGALPAGATGGAALKDGDDVKNFLMGM